MKTSLKNLRQFRDQLNSNLSEGSSEKYFVTVYDHCIDTGLQINVIKTMDLYAEKDFTNWAYKLVYGEIQKETK